MLLVPNIYQSSIKSQDGKYGYISVGSIATGLWLSGKKKLFVIDN